jgi:tetratricopeptide (TPR) repeat protein
VRRSDGPAAAAQAYATNSLLRTDGSKGPAAAAAFEQAIALDPASPLPRAGFAEAAFNAWRSTQEDTWLTRGREQLAQAIERSPESPSVHLAAGKLSLAPGAYERAREEFQRATQIEPSSAEAWRGLALAYESMTGHENEAAAAYLKASQVQPSYYGPLNDLCLFYRRLGKYSQAMDYCRQVTQLAPALTGPLNLGVVLSGQAGTPMPNGVSPGARYRFQIAGCPTNLSANTSTWDATPTLSPACGRPAP